jgi:uroporphyrinogen decarboxylase
MRQAGRFDPAYRALRERDGRPLEQLFQCPDAATEISLLPQRFGVDAVIFFQDILTPLGPLGAPFVFRPGPVLEHPPRTRADIEALQPFEMQAGVPFVGETLRRLRRRLNGALPLLGFAGAPFTLAAFLLEGQSPGQAAPALERFLTTEPALAHELLGKLADMTAAYLRYQLANGADAIQLFESCANLLSAEQYRTFALPYQQRVFAQLPDDALTIMFARELDDPELLAAAGPRVLSLSAAVTVDAARAAVGPGFALQGNVDNQLLAHGDLPAIEAAVRACIAAGQHTGHILNLSHGLLKDTPVEHVQRLIALAHETHCDPVDSIGNPDR